MFKDSGGADHVEYGPLACSGVQESEQHQIRLDSNEATMSLPATSGVAVASSSESQLPRAADY